MLTSKSKLLAKTICDNRTSFCRCRERSLSVMSQQSLGTQSHKLFIVYVFFELPYPDHVYHMYSSIHAAEYFVFQTEVFEEIFCIPPCVPGTHAEVSGSSLNIVEFG
jgi:hypothetical protein